MQKDVTMHSALKRLAKFGIQRKKKKKKKPATKKNNSQVRDVLIQSPCAYTNGRFAVCGQAHQEPWCSPVYEP